MTLARFFLSVRSGWGRFHHGEIRLESVPKSSFSSFSMGFLVDFFLAETLAEVVELGTGSELEGVPFS